jgi:hypothetical protein
MLRGQGPFSKQYRVTTALLKQSKQHRVTTALLKQSKQHRQGNNSPTETEQTAQAG